MLTTLASSTQACEQPSTSCLILSNQEATLRPYLSSIQYLTNLHLGFNSTILREQTSFLHAALSTAYSGKTCNSVMSYPLPSILHSWLPLPSTLPNNPAEPVGLSSSNATDQNHSLR